MAGPRLDRRPDRGRRFARDLIDVAHANATVWRRSRLGPWGLRVGIRTDDDLGRLILGAFLPESDVPDGFSLAVVRHGEIATPLLTQWADEWTQTARLVPPEITHPHRVFFDRQVGIAYAFDRVHRRGAVWIRRDVELDLRSFITPFRLMLSWMAGTAGAAVVHASAAVVDDTGFAFSGASGSGKSTLATGLGLAGHGFVSDDCLLLRDGVAYAVYARGKLDATSAQIVGAHDLALRTLPNAARAKQYFDVADLGDRFVPEHRLDAWGFPVLDLGTGHYRLAERRAFRMLATDSLREIFGGGPRERLLLARAIRRFPAYRILVGSQMAVNADVVGEIAAELARDGIGSVAPVSARGGGWRG